MNIPFTFDQNLIQKTKAVSKNALYLLAVLSLINLFLNFINIQIPGIYTSNAESAIIFILSFAALCTEPESTSLGKLASFAYSSLVFLSVYLLWIFINTFINGSPENEKLQISLESLICFLSSTQALFFRKSKEVKFLIISQLFSVGTILITISTIFAFILGSQLLQSKLFFSDTSLPVAISILLFSISLLMQRPTDGLMTVVFAENIGSRHLRNSTLFAFPLLAITAIIASLGSQHGFYDFHYAFNIIVISSFIIFGFALFATTRYLNKNDREREIAIDVLKQKEFDLMEAQKLAHVGSWTLEVGSNNPNWSLEMYNIYGIPAGTPITLSTIESYFAENDLKNIQMQMQNCIEKGTPVDIKHSFKQKNGTEKTVHGRAELRLNKVTGKKEVHGTLHDISEISATLNDLIETKKMYTDLYNEAPDMLLSVNPNTGIVLKCNRTLLNNLGYEMDEVVGHHISKFYTPESIAIIPQLSKDFIKTGSINNIELAVLTKNKNRIDVSLSSTLVRGKNGEILNSRSVWRNISDVKIARELEIRKRAAEESSRLKSNFVATMSHEIRTPLNGVIGLSEVLMATKLNSEQYDIVDTIKQSANTLFYLVNDILDFSKIESGRMELVPSYFSLKVLLVEVEKQLRWAAFKKELGISFSVKGADRLNFYGDRNRIQQILTNLISNAIKFTERGKIDVNVSVTTTSTTISKIYFEVIDTGIGISANDQALLFKPFYQSDSTLSRSSGGTGLGLSISQTLAELMESKILIESALGRGSKFHFTLDLPHEFVKDQNFDMHTNTFYRFEKNPKILVAEDIDTNRKVLGTMLADFGCSYVFASNGEEALAIVQSQPFDLVLMDCQMPKLDGLGAVRKIRNLTTEVNKIPVIAITAHASKEDRKHCLDAGMSDYISKPFTKGILNDVLTKWLRPGNSQVYSTTATSDVSITSILVDERILNDLKTLTSNNSDDLIKDTVSIFEKNLPTRIQAIKTAITNRSQSEAKNATHTLKSAASTFGGSAIARLCDQITEDIKNENYLDASLKTEFLVPEVQKTTHYIYSWMLEQSS
tara:strand:+ start:26423 stop:29584 length:3162 start_codon:yes stop_codon:yes gene_type:complete